MKTKLKKHNLHMTIPVFLKEKINAKVKRIEKSITTYVRNLIEDDLRRDSL